MSWLVKMGWRRTSLGLLVVVMLSWAATHLFASDPEIALILGEPWENMRQRSSATIGPAIPGHHWGRLPKSDARLRFIDPEFGFVTPSARFFTVSFDNKERISSIRMSPQVEPLLLDDALKVVLDLQEQWHQTGWIPIRAKFNPPIADTPQWRARLQDENQGSTSYWHASDKYQVMLVVARFDDYRNPKEERYLITLQLATPWVDP